MTKKRYQKFDLFSYIKANFKADQIFDISSFKDCCISYDNLRQKLSRLAREKKIYRISNGKYSLSDEKTKNDVLVAKYLKDGRKTIGYLGILDFNGKRVQTNKYGLLEIVSNNESSRGRNLKLNNKIYKIRCPHCKINHFNYRMLVLFDFINYSQTSEITFQLHEIKQYIQKYGYAFRSYKRALGNYPATVSRKLLETGLFDTILMVTRSKKPYKHIV